MLVSHLKRFIYLKTVKTAGTSIEIYFERYCVGPDDYAGECHARAASVSEWGIVGSRGPDERHPVWHNHVPARRLRELVGDDTWRSYFKFCAVRNPFDKVVSHFWFEMDEKTRHALRTADFDIVRSAFVTWVREARLPLDFQVYCIDGCPAIDAVVRYEHLDPDLEGICRTLDVPWERERLGRYKSEHRVRAEPFPMYYDESAERCVRARYQWEIERFGYANR